MAGDEIRLSNDETGGEKIRAPDIESYGKKRTTISNDLRHHPGILGDAEPISGCALRFFEILMPGITAVAPINRLPLKHTTISIFENCQPEIEFTNRCRQWLSHSGGQPARMRFATNANLHAGNLGKALQGFNSRCF